MVSIGTAIPSHRALSAPIQPSFSFLSAWSSSSSRMGCFLSPLKFNGVSVSLPLKRIVIRAARTESKGVSLGAKAPHFQLPEPLTGKTWTLQDFEAYPVLLVMFICNHCPFVKHLKKDIVKLSNFYMKKGLAVVAISSNSITTHPQDGPEFMAEEAKLYGYPFPYLYDESQDVARDFGAVCTPQFFLFKKDGRRPFELVYHGQFDDSRPSNNVPITGRLYLQLIDLYGLESGNRQCPQWSTSATRPKAQRWMQHQVASRSTNVII